MSELKIEVGKSYQTRGGKKADVRYFENGAFIGHAFVNGKTAAYSWTEDGMRNDCSVISSFDLVAEWSKPQPMTDGELRELFLSHVPIVSKRTGSIYFMGVFDGTRIQMASGLSSGVSFSSDELLESFTYLDGSPICSKEKS